jgi:hypothetical protein
MLGPASRTDVKIRAEQEVNNKQLTSLAFPGEKEITHEGFGDESLGGHVYFTKFRPGNITYNNCTVIYVHARGTTLNIPNNAAQLQESSSRKSMKEIFIEESKKLLTKEFWTRVVKIIKQILFVLSIVCRTFAG